MLKIAYGLSVLHFLIDTTVADHAVASPRVCVAVGLPFCRGSGVRVEVARCLQRSSPVYVCMLELLIVCTCTSMLVIVCVHK